MCTPPFEAPQEQAPDPLAVRLGQGDTEALAEAFSLHRERLAALVRFRLSQRLSQRIDVEDVLQEAYLDAAQRLTHFTAEAFPSVFLWLRHIVTQTLVDLHRRHLGAQRRDARREVFINGCQFPEATSTSLAIHLAGNLTSPSQAAMRVEFADRLDQILQGMDPIDREVLALRHFEELTNVEVAAVLGIQQKAASIRYVRAIERLKKIVAEIPGFLDGSEAGPPR